MENRLIVTCSPHVRDNSTTSSVMRDVLIALAPAAVAAVVIFGARSLVLMAVCVAVCMGSEWLFEKATGRANTLGDLSAAVTGLLLAMNLPVGLPLWQAAFGSIVAIVVVKQLFGGIGQNFANPAITARIVLLVSFAGPMTTWVTPGAVDGVGGATPLALMASGQAPPPLGTLLVGFHGGCLGETCSVALLLGCVYLLWRKVISWHIPVSFVATVAVLTFLFGQNPVNHIFTGGLLIGAIFMATDYSTSPATNSGKLIFGIGCGLLTAVIRVFGSYPEGVSFAILLMNIVAPHISNLTSNKAFGGVKA